VLTKYEAEERALRIWGEDVKLWGCINGKWSLDSRDKSHVMDQNGHPTCHHECKVLEELTCS
jgi:hypothetical protein